MGIGFWEQMILKMKDQDKGVFSEKLLQFLEIASRVFLV